MVGLPEHFIEDHKRGVQIVHVFQIILKELFEYRGMLLKKSLQVRSCFQQETEGGKRALVGAIKGEYLLSYLERKAVSCVLTYANILKEAIEVYS